MKLSQRDVWSRVLLLVGSALLLSCAKAGSAPVENDASATGAPLAFAPGWYATASMSTTRAQHAAVLLGDGRVLVINGVSRTGFVATSDLYDPATNTWTATGATGITGNITQAVRLLDGRVFALTDGSQACSVYDPATGTWTATGAMSATRSQPSVTLLDSGRVLVAGGTSGGSRLTTAELYDPATNTFSPTGSMAQGRNGHSATRLQDGRVLAISGFNTGEVAGAELYAPATGTWTAVAPPLVPRHYFTSTLLPDGRVLVAGGFSGAGAISQAELYDPGSNTWTATGSMGFVRSGHMANLLPDGKVLVTGGAAFRQDPTRVSEVYDPATGAWAPAGTMLVGRENHTATLLPSGKVFVVGGYTESTLTFFDSTELYDPGSNAWSPAGALAGTREDAVVALLPTGRVLVAGGHGGGGAALATAQLYARAANTWTAAASLSTPRDRATATVLRSGAVLVAGGQNGGASLASAERYDAATNTWSPAAALAGARHFHTATLLADGRVLVVGGQQNAAVLGTAEVYDPVANTWAPAGSLATARSGHAAALLPNGRVLVAGGRDGGGAALASAEVYDPAANTWTAVASMAEGREGLSLTLLPNGKVMAAGGLSGAAGLTTSELYDVAGNTWASGTDLSEAHAYHTATLMPSGKLLVAGGQSAPAVAATTADVFDVAFDDWTPVAAPASRGRVGAAALPSGEVLLVGGTAATTAELFEDTGSLPAWRPVVSPSNNLYLSCSATLNGQRFRGISGASGGNTADSPTDLPVIRLRSPGGEQLWTLSATAMSATSATVAVPATLPPGPYGLTLFTNALHGGLMVTVAPNTAPAAQAQTVAATAGTGTAVTLAANEPDPGQTLTWTIVTPPAHGTLSGTPPALTYTPNPGYVGADSFTFRVRDCGLDSNVATVDINVAEAVGAAPVITCPADTEAEATGPAGAPGNWPDATATDAETANPTITYSPPRENVFPLGTTTITATATDEAGNTASCTFQYTVRDTTGPTLTCPADVQVLAEGAEGTPVTYEPPQVSDAVSTPEVTASPPSGSRFPTGTSRVSYTAVDAAGNASQCYFQVTVQAEVVAIEGGGCQSTGSGTASALALLVGLALWRGTRRRSLRTRGPALVALVAACFAPAVHAQSTGVITPIALERLHFMPAGTDSLLVDTGNVLPEGGYRLLFMAGYERGILVLQGSDGVERNIIDYRVTGWLAGAWSPVDRLELSARLPVIITQGGEGADQLVGVTEPKSFGLGTPELGARYGLLRREDGDPVFLSLGLDVGLPGGTARAFGRQDGWAGFQLAPRIAVGREVGPLALGASAGVRIRSKEVEPGRNFGSELEQELVVATRGEGLRGEVALQAAESLVQSDVALELLGGLRLPLGSGFEAFALAGHGFTDIPGTPSLRINAGIAWAHTPPPREDPCKAGRTHTPEQCPDLDDDGDTVANGQDRCPLEAGAVENQGCPDKDSDGDSVVDREDACPSQPGLPRYKGCPAPDADGDGIPDDEDACPKEAGDAAHHGCPPPKETPAETPPPREEPPAPQTPPEKAPPAEEPTELPTDHHVLFPVGESALQENEKQQLDAIVDYLKAHPKLSVRIEGHTDNTGPEELNRTLSQQRADKVRAYLIQHGIRASRLTAKGYGPDRPLNGNNTPEEQRLNRRVEFITESRGSKR